MCLLTIVPKGVDKYSEFLIEGIKTASITNTDGAGFAFKRNTTKKVYISKGYQNVEDLLAALVKHKLKIDDELIIHQRIGNKGAKNVDMNHPFVLSNDKEEILQNNRYVNKPIMAHNGTISYHTKHNSLMSDTYWFIEEVMYQKDMINMLKTDLLFFEYLLLSRLGTNKLAFLFPNEDTNFIKIGEFKEDQGYLFSNESYKNRNIRNVGGQNVDCGYPRYPYRGSEDFDDYWNDLEDERKPAASIIPSTRFNNNNVIDNTKLKNASRANDDLIIDNGGLAFDDSITGIKYKLYMDIWVPQKFYTTNQFQSLRFNPTIFNYTDFTFKAIKNDNDLGVKKGCFYEIIDFDEAMVREGEGLHSFIRKYGADHLMKSEIIYIPHYQIKELFETSPVGNKIMKYYGFFKLVKELNASKNILKDVNKALDPVKYNSDKTRFKHVDYKTGSALSLFQLLLTKHLYPTTFKAELDKKNIVVVN